MNSKRNLNPFRASKIDLSALYVTIENNHPFNRLEPGIHGAGHARRVLLFSQLIAALIEEAPDAVPVDRPLLLIASLLHDCGRRNNGIDPEHAYRSAEMAVEFCRRHDIGCDREKLRDCIRYHCKSGCYPLRDPSIEARILADADKLDRFRFHSASSPLNASLLELNVSHDLIPMARDLNGHPSAC
ncbi:MAG TPA: HD domain-containing protein [Candidatus Aminicenantes bacterium]|nr:HD domain-containing protein [Candidatus Aminicenantes bacterium]